MLSRIRSALAGRYVIERLLGRGATAAVYAARDLKHGRRVALKVIEPDVVSTLGAGRFLQEIRTTARLNHPHVLPLFDSGDAQGCIYYTMPIVEGESLRARLDRETCMPLEAVLPIAHQVAGALSYAHAAGIVHRDIKPENILIDGQDHVWVADFGLARARASAMDQRLTATGAAVGSPHYMSPEQAAGENDVDGRSDIYSFTCVLFEMLAGEPPFSAHTVPALLARHISEPAPAVSERCPELPPGVSAAFQRGMSKDPADRFRDARDLVTALERPGVDGPPPAAAQRRHGSSPARSPFRRARPWQWAGAVLVMTTIVALALADDPFGVFVGRGVASTADSSRYLLLPVERVGDSPSMNDEHLMRTAFARWRDVDVVGDADVERVLARRSSGTVALDDYNDLGRDLRSSRIVRTTVAAYGDSVRVDAVMHDRAGHQIAAHTVGMARTESRPDVHYARLADALLFAGLWQYDRDAPGTDSRAAQTAYLAGLASIAEWDLARADSLFMAATTADAQFARALAWHAQAVFWMHGATAAMRTAAERAIAAAEGESSRARLMAESLLAMGRDDYPAACDRYERMLEADPRDYAATRGLADCHSLDQVVLPDTSSPTGWRFRSSGHRALLYHQRAFELLPASHRAYSHGRFLKLREGIFYTGVSAHRSGLNAEGVSFNAEPEWNDTLVLHPISRLEVSQLRAPVSSSAVAAVTHLRRIFFDVTAGWVAAYPRSPEALEAHAIAMELQGDTRALATLDRARSYVTDPEHAVNLSISEFWLMLKRAVPHALDDIRAARLLADSIMEYAGPMAPQTARRMAAVAAVTGRGHRAASLARRSAEAVTQPLAVAEVGAVLLAYAAVGDYPDSLRAYEKRVETAITNLMRPEQVPQARGELLGRAASLALPEFRMSFMDAPGTGDYLIEAMSAHATGDTERVRRIFEGIAESRAVFRPADIKLEVLLPEAWLLLRMGDADAALRWFAPTLDDFRYMDPGPLEDVAAAGPLARVMLLRAEIASELGDSAGARTWAAVVTELWTHADAELRPAVGRAADLAARAGD